MLFLTFHVLHPCEKCYEGVQEMGTAQKIESYVRSQYMLITWPSNVVTEFFLCWIMVPFLYFLLGGIVRETRPVHTNNGKLSPGIRVVQPESSPVPEKIFQENSGDSGRLDRCRRNVPGDSFRAQKTCFCLNLFWMTNTADFNRLFITSFFFEKVNPFRFGWKYKQIWVLLSETFYQLSGYLFIGKIVIRNNPTACESCGLKLPKVLRL